MLYKEILCPKCKGFGHVCIDKDSISAQNCPDCDGKGTNIVPMTNGDIIRTCTNEQFIEVRKNLEQYALYSGGSNNRLLDSSNEDFLLWLNKDSDDLDLETIFPFIDKEKYKYPLTYTWRL